MAVEALWLLAALALPLLLFLWRRGAAARARLARCGELIPGPPTLPLLGNAFDSPTDYTEMIPVARKFLKKYGPVFRLWVGPLHISIILSDPRDIEALLSKQKNLKKFITYDFLHSWLGRGLLTSDGERWQKHRKIITPTFHFKILEQFVEIFNKQGDILVALLNERADGQFFDISPLIDCYTQDVICESAMGVELHSQINGHSSSYLKAVKETCEGVAKRTSKPWFFLDFIYRLTPTGRRERRNVKILHDFTKEVIKRRREQLEEDPTALEETLDDFGIKRKMAFLDVLILSSRDRKVLSDEDIREEVDTFMFEGHDTTASATSFALLELSKRPDIQEKIHNELNDVCRDESGELSFSMANLNNLKYLEQVIKETLRMYPTVPLFGRLLTEDMELASLPVTVPAGAIVAVPPVLLHYNSQIYPNPETFNPENFSPEAVLGRHPYAYVPFSAGPRNCIGQRFAMLEIKSVLGKIVWNFSLKIKPQFQSVLLPEITLKSFNGIQISLLRRKHTNT